MTGIASVAMSGTSCHCGYKIMRYTLIVIFISVLLLGGCSSAAGPPVATETTTPTNYPINMPKPTETTTVTLQPTSSPTSTYTPTSEINLATNTATVTVEKQPADTEIVIEDTMLTTKCLEIIPEIPPDLESSGVLVLDSHVDLGNGSTSSDTYLIDMSTKTKTQIAQPNENLFNFNISPDRTWLAYGQAIFDEDRIHPSEENLIIATADGQIYTSMRWEPEWWFIEEWLDNQWLIIETEINDEVNEDSNKSAYLLVNPFTTERKILKSEFPDSNELTYTVYDPKLTRVAYLKKGRFDDAPWAPIFTLMDVNTQKTLVNLDLYLDYRTEPHWETGGEYFAIAPSLLTDNFGEEWPSYEILKVTKDGEISKMTNLLEHYQWVYISDLSWSPDNRYIAFWFSTWQDEKPSITDCKEQQLAILDTITGHVTNYCIQGDYFAHVSGARKVSAPIWSPDSKQIVVENRYSEYQNRVILVDLDQEIAFLVAEEMEPVGWLLNP
jgi:hypothetical protein